MPQLNPFVFNRPVSADGLIDRDEETEQMLHLAEGGHAVRLSAPRRYGKTSLLRRLGEEADKAGMHYVEVDFYGVLSRVEVAGRLEEGYAKLRPAPQRIARAVIQTLRPALSVGAAGVRVEAHPQLEEQVGRRLSGLLDLPLQLYERTGKRTLVAFDEFQALLSVDDGIDGLFRSRIQRHGDAASYVFAGSHPGLMAHLFGAHERPFFGQARSLPLAPLADGDIVEHVGERFAATGREVGRTIEPLLDLAAGHPQRAMLLAHHLWERTPDRGVAEADHWQAALRDTFSEQDDALRATWDSLEVKERAVYTALAVGAPIFGVRTLERFNLSKGGAQHARKALAQVGHIQRSGDVWLPVDPLLARWVIDFQHNGGEDPFR
ncbi:MAG: ATP-binding protein [Actinobacteria bacterium]|nr:ATP-binding protein [Actinomycetota bacterium]